MQQWAPRNAIRDKACFSVAEHLLLAYNRHHENQSQTGGAHYRRGYPGYFVDGFFWYPINIRLRPRQTARQVFKQGDKAKTPDEKIHWFTRSIQADPKNVHAYVQRGLSYLDKDQMTAAMADFNKAVQVAPDSPEGYISRSLAYAIQGNYDKAWEDVAACQRLGGEMPPNFMAGLRKKSGCDGPSTRPRIQP